MSTRNLTEAILDGGIYSINFFNGRLLSGEDLSQEQGANSEARRRMGLAIGDGIAAGLEVSESVDASKPDAPVVTVKAGLAVNRQGNTLELAADTDVSLVMPGTSAGTSQGLFATCQPPGTYIAGAGVYLLTVAPATGTQGLASVSGLGNVAASCNVRYNIDGVQFRLIAVNLPVETVQDSTRLRNVLAHLCFGTSDFLVQTFAFEPLSNALQGGYGLLDTLRQSGGTQVGCLTDADVPLAMISWTLDNGIEFIDRWSVRRRITRPSPDTRWPLLIGDRRRSEAEAMFLQFEDQVRDISTNEVDNMRTMVATQRFTTLPPFGFLPMVGGGSITGFEFNTFFGTFSQRPLSTDTIAMTNGNLLRPLLQEALYHDPISLIGPDTSSKFQLYSIWENVQAVQNGLTDQLTLVFASSTLPYRGIARFGYANLGLSHFPQTVR
ncbi:MAG TPA: hypothetical protein VFQ30_00580 [Ktedonobacteraceae bacterium]|nr:hypothetical protein [Ktedonobacteraceae bacterium]